jgi:hypothetical protein
MNINSENLKNIFKGSNFKKIFFDFLARWSKLVIFFLAILGTAYCVSLWYIFIYNPGWSDAQKQQYLQTKGQGIVFDRAKFNVLVTAAKNRAAAESQVPSNVPDIFRLKALILPPGATNSNSAPSAAAPSTGAAGTNAASSASTPPAANPAPAANPSRK